MDEDDRPSARLSPGPLYELRTYAEHIEDALNGKLSSAGEEFILTRMGQFGDLRHKLIKQPVYLEQKKRDLLAKITRYEQVFRQNRVEFDPWKNDLRPRPVPKKKPADPEPVGPKPRPNSAIKPPPERVIEKAPEPVKQPKPPKPAKQPQARVIAAVVPPPVVGVPPSNENKPVPVMVALPPQPAVAKSLLTPSLSDAWYKAACIDCRVTLNLADTPMPDRLEIHERFNRAYAALREVCKGKAQVPLIDPNVLAAVHKAAGGDRFGAYVTNAFRTVAKDFVSENGREIYQPANQNSADAPESLAMPAVLSGREIA
jgi:hypothetical protein